MERPRNPGRCSGFEEKIHLVFVAMISWVTRTLDSTW